MCCWNSKQCLNVLINHIVTDPNKKKSRHFYVGKVSLKIKFWVEILGTFQEVTVLCHVKLLILKICRESKAAKQQALTVYMEGFPSYDTYK